MCETTEAEITLMQRSSRGRQPTNGRRVHSGDMLLLLLRLHGGAVGGAGSAVAPPRLTLDSVQLLACSERSALGAVNCASNHTRADGKGVYV